MTVEPIGSASRLLDDPGLRRVLDLLDRDGEEARVVGGAVRNALMNRPDTDHDIATTALPGVVLARAKTVGIKTIETGITHGTVTLRVDGRSFEVTTLREDIETDGRHAKIRFGRDFALDALRRDFSINALSMGRNGEVHDYAGGLADIAAGRVRFIGDPATRIREDFLRILRFFRFSAEYAAGDLDAEALAACVSEWHGLARLSRERVRQELLKLLTARRAVFAVTAMAEAGLLGALLSGVAQPARLARLLAVDVDADAILRLAATAAIVPEDAMRLQDRLRLSNAETLRLATATSAFCRLRGAMPPADEALRIRMFKDGRTGALDGLKLAWTESGAAPEDAAWSRALAYLRETPEPKMPFSGADLLARGVPGGRALGDALKRLQASWIAAGLPQDAPRVAALLDDVARG